MAASRETAFYDVLGQIESLRSRVESLEAQQQENSAFIAWLQDDETVTDPIPGEPAEGESDDGGA